MQRTSARLFDKQTETAGRKGIAKPEAAALRRKPAKLIERYADWQPRCLRSREDRWLCAPTSRSVCL